jgi:hypothetical protein
MRRATATLRHKGHKITKDTKLVGFVLSSSTPNSQTYFVSFVVLVIFVPGA